MTNHTNLKFAWMMLISLMIVIAATLILCLVDIGGAGSIVAVVDGAAALLFAICPTMAERAERMEKAKLEEEVKTAPMAAA